MNVNAMRQYGRESREKVLKRLDVFALWRILETNYHKATPNPAVFDQEAWGNLKKAYIAEILDIEFGAESM